MKTPTTCFIPNPVTVDLGTIVTWSNTDTAAHTATSGSAADGPTGVLTAAWLWQVEVSPIQLIP